MRPPEIRPMQKRYRIARTSKTEIHLHCDRCTKAERRLISERTKDGIAAARAQGKRPGRQPLDTKKVEAAMKLVSAGTSPAETANQLGLGRSTVYREMRRLGIGRAA